MAQGRLGGLRAWAAENGATIHPAVELYVDPVTGSSFRVKSSASTALAPNEPIVSCPPSLMLCYLNAVDVGPFQSHTGSDEAFPARFLDEVAPHIISRFFLTQQYLLGRKSFWYPYIAALPQPDRLIDWMLPPFWPEEDRDWFAATNLEVSCDEIAARAKAEYKAAIKILKAESWPGWKNYSQVLYRWAYCVFSSRSFRPSLVLPDTILRNALHAKETRENLTAEDFSVLMPLFDICNHSMLAPITWDISNSRTCMLRVDRAHEPGEQIYNNYGAKTNAELLVGYGFMVPESDTMHNDYVHVRAAKREKLSSWWEADDRPAEFLFSLRPMDDPSSVSGRQKQILEPVLFEKLGRKKNPAFQRVQDHMVWDMAVALIPEEERLAHFGGPGNPRRAGTWTQQAMIEEALKSLLYSAPGDDWSLAVVQQIAGLIHAKCTSDLGLLMQSQPDREPESKYQRVAEEYRQKQINILTAVAESTVGSLADVEGGHYTEGLEEQTCT